MTVRTMYDGVDADALPAGATMVAGYANGDYQWDAADWNRFPHAVKVRIDVNGTDPLADVLDLERGDAVLAQVRGWIEARVPHGRACIYTSASNIEALSAECKGMIGVDVWAASWTGEPHEVAVPGNLHLCAVQYRNTPGYDESAVYDTTWPAGEA